MSLYKSSVLLLVLPRGHAQTPPPSLPTNLPTHPPPTHPLQPTAAYAWCPPASNGAIAGPRRGRLVERGTKRSLGPEGRETTGQNPFA